MTELEVLQRQLHEARAPGAGLVAASPDLLARLSADGSILELAGTGENVHEGEAVGANVRHCHLEGVGQQTLAAMRRAREHNRVEAFEYAAGAPLGSKWYELRVVPLDGGEFLAIKRNVTDRHAHTESLKVSREKAVVASARKSEFLANLSHEIRTPLNAILGVTQLLQTRTLEPEQGEFVSMLDAAAESLRGLVNEVLDLSRIEEGRVELQQVSFDPLVTTRRAVEPLQQLAQKKNLSLSVEAGPGAEATAVGDPVRVAQVVTNLVANALKFTERGFVKVELNREADTLVLRVSDSGAGVAPQMMKEIFEPFVQASGNTGITGTGLGLTITRHLVALMNGEVSVQSTLGRGSTFTARLHLPPHARAIAPPVPRRTGGRSMRVLVAEDDQVNARMTAALLEKLGHSVRVVPDGAVAVQAAAEENFDLILMDVQMPVLDGLGATRSIRQNASATTRVPIVALTANAMKGDERTCLSAGMDAYLPKPVTIDALSDMLVWFSGKS